MSLLKTNEIQNYNGSSLTLTASTVSTSAQLNTGGNISVTGSLNVSDDSTTRTNLGLGTIATQDADSITVTGGSVTGTEIDLKSSGTTIYKSDGTTSVLSESGGVVTLNNGTIGDSVIFPNGATISGQTGAGHILQVQSITKTDTFSASITAGGVADITGMTVKLTPSSSSNKILILTMVNGASNDAGRQSGFAVRLQRDGSNIALPTGYGSRPASWFAMDVVASDNDTSNSSSFGMFFDAPATTSEVVYKLQFLNYTSATITYYLNQTESAIDAVGRNRTISTMTIMEIQG